jgi:hypothetical protein
MGLADIAKHLQTGALGGAPAMRTADNTGNAPGFTSGWPKGIDDMAKVGKAPDVAPDGWRGSGLLAEDHVQD